tara:strand:- start:101 stop:622 length:522 start_codon:yes stop_codon:yes gene_type:complete
MIKLKDLLIEKKLRVFDFDDTLVKTDSKIYVTNKGETKTLTPGEYAVYKPKSDDEFDFKDFNDVIKPKQIKPIMKVFRKIVSATGKRKINILTARGNYKPIKKFLSDIGFPGIYIIALNSSNPQDKADWIEDKIKKGYDDVVFWDDSSKNIKVVDKLQSKYPKVKIKTQLVRY